jgi:hypothetical protein
MIQRKSALNYFRVLLTKCVAYAACFTVLYNMEYSIPIPRGKSGIGMEWNGWNLEYSMWNGPLEWCHSDYGKTYVHTKSTYL